MLPALLLFLSLLGAFVGAACLVCAASDRYSLPAYHPAALAAPYLARAGAGLLALSALLGAAAWVLA